MAEKALSGTVLDAKVLGVLSDRRGPVKAHTIYDQLSKTNTVHAHEVARSVWRLVDDGKAQVRAGQGVSLRSSDSGSQ